MGPMRWKNYSTPTKQLEPDESYHTNAVLSPQARILPYVMKHFDPRALLKYDYEKLSSKPRQSPPGYVFVPKGDVYITRNCRKLTKEQGRIVWVVYNPATGKAIGLHIPRAVYQEVKANAAASATARQNAVLRKDERDLESASVVLARLFPHIPPKSAEEVLGHAFMKGSGRVGRSQTLTLEQKVRSAVLAHIRHVYTPYDKLLKTISREDAREQIWSAVQDTAKSWGPTGREPVRKSELRDAYMEDSTSPGPQTGSDDEVEEVTREKWQEARLKPQPRSAALRSSCSGRVVKPGSTPQSSKKKAYQVKLKPRRIPKATVDPKDLDKAVKFVRQYETVPLDQLTEAEKHRLRDSRRQIQKARVLTPTK